MSSVLADIVSSKILNNICVWMIDSDCLEPLSVRLSFIQGDREIVSKDFMSNVLI